MKKFIIALVLILSGISAFGQSYNIHIKVTVSTRARRHTSVYTSPLERHIYSYGLQDVSVYCKDIDTGYNLKSTDLWNLKYTFVETFVMHYENLSFLEDCNDFTKYTLCKDILKKVDFIKKRAKGKREEAETFKQYGEARKNLATINGAIEFYSKMRDDCYRNMVREYYAQKDAEYREIAIRDSIAVEKATFHLSSQD